MRLKSRSEIIVVSILGMLYTAVRATWLLLDNRLNEFEISVYKNLTRIQELLGEQREVISEKRSTLSEKQKHELLASGSWLIGLIFIGLVGLICL